MKPWLTFAIAVMSWACSGRPIDDARGGLSPLDGQPPVGMERARCDACHGAGLAPGWATDSASISEIKLERHRGGAYSGFSALKTLTFAASGAVTRSVEITGQPPPIGLGSFGVSSNENAKASLSEAQWQSFAERVVQDGLFRFQGEAVTEWATHQESAFVFVHRSGRTECVLGSMSITTDPEHTTFHGLLEAFDALEQGLEWRDADG